MEQDIASSISTSLKNDRLPESALESFLILFPALLELLNSRRLLLVLVLFNYVPPPVQSLISLNPIPLLPFVFCPITITVNNMIIMRTRRQSVCCMLCIVVLATDDDDDAILGWKSNLCECVKHSPRISPSPRRPRPVVIPA